MMGQKESKIIGNNLIDSTKQAELVVITVWYNRSEHVKRSISSILNQTADNYTIFAVDDGSTDDTGDKLEEMLSKAEDNSIPMQVWRKPNEGFVSSLKQAIEEKTDNVIIALHGAGDISKPNRLQTQLEMLQNNNSVIATGVGVETINPEGVSIGKKIPPKWPNSDPFSGVVPRLGTHGASMYYRDQYQEIGGYREQFRYAQDTDLLLRLRVCGMFMNTEEVLYSKLVSDKTVSSNSDWKQNLEQIIYSAAALESARCRRRGEQDPIDAVDPGDWSKIKTVAKHDGLHERAVRRSGILVERCIRNGNVSAIITIIQFIGITGLLTVAGYLPEYILK